MTQARQSDRINPTMNLHHLLNARRAAGKPVRVALLPPASRKEDGKVLEDNAAKLIAALK